MISRGSQSLFLSLALGSLSACGGGGTPPGGGEVVTPITERPVRSHYHCRVDRGLTETAPLLWSPWPVMTTTAAGNTYLARVESTMTDPFFPGPGQVTVSTFTAAGVLGPPARLASLPPGASVYLDVAPRTDGAAVVWADTATDTLTFASIDGAGQTVTAARSIPIDTAERRLGNVKLAAGSDGGFALIYQLVTINGVRELRLAMLSAEGALRGTPRLLATGSSSFSDVEAQIVGVPGGYAMISVAPNAVRGRIDFSKVDLAGVETVAPRAISVTDREGTLVGYGGFWSAGISLLPDGDGFLAAWPEQDRGNIDNNTGASAVVRLVRLAADGARLGTPAALRAPVLDVDEIEPSLVKFQDSVAVLWSRGSHIYVCAGCIPDHRIDLMLIDPVDLVPVSEVVTVSPALAADNTLRGGLLRKSMAAQGASILTAFNITYHTSYRSASATFVCE